MVCVSPRRYQETIKACGTVVIRETPTRTTSRIWAVLDSVDVSSTLFADIRMTIGGRKHQCLKLETRVLHINNHNVILTKCAMIGLLIRSLCSRIEKFG